MRAWLGLLLLTVSALAGAEVYKWVDEKGVVHYTDEPPTKGAKPANLPPLQTYQQGTLPNPQRVEAPPAPRAAAPPAVKIVAPTADETYRDPEATVAVAVQVVPALADGQSLVYHVNGSVKDGPTSSTALSLQGLERGAHTISVAVVDNAGKELTRSAPVTVHMKPPIARPPPPKKK